AVRRPYRVGSIVYLQSVDGKDTARLGLDLKWGGAVVEVSVHGVNVVNSFDAGRELQVALWDGADGYDTCAGCTGMFGWNPVQAGDRYSHGSPVTRIRASGDTVYVKTRPYEWFPDNKGGGPQKPVSSDCEIEEWASPVAGYARTFLLRYRITHLGDDEHVNAQQEFPAVYVNVEFDRFAHYGGDAPWTGGPVSFTTLPSLERGAASVPYLFFNSEGWGALVDGSGVGLTVYVPGAYPYVAAGFTVAGSGGPRGLGTNYFRPFTPYSFGPHAAFTGDVYVIAGSLDVARQVVYRLGELDHPDSFAPFGYVDVPKAHSVLRGSVAVTGWATDKVSVSRVMVYLDERVIGAAAYGLARPDVRRVFPGAPSNVGFRYLLDTRRF